MGSQDSGVSIWLTSTSRAVIVIKELFTHSVLDLAWSSDGLKLYACSYDGSIAAVEFEEKDFGVRMDSRQVSERVERAGRVQVVPPESIEILQLEERLKNKKDDPMERLFDNSGENEGFLGGSVPVPSKTTVTTPTPITPRKKFHINQQAVTIDKDGKKRIKPVLVQASVPITSPQKQLLDNNNNRENIPDRDTKRLRLDDIGVTSYTIPTVQQVKPNLFKLPPVQKFFSVQAERFGNTDTTEFKNNANGD